MTDSSINLVNLDFDTFKQQLKTYLKSQPIFQDYDFDGSNMSVLLDVLSYNTYLNSFYLNMIGNEMFLDTAVLKDSVVSRAKELNYTPRSFNSARAVVDIAVQTDGSIPTITMPKGTSFNTRIGSNSFTFTTDRNITFSGSNTLFTTGEITLYEGQYITDTFTINYSDTGQRFILSNPTADITSLSVAVVEDNGSNTLSYLRASSLFDKQSNSQIYFVQAAEGEKYEILFGDGVIGRKPKDNSIIVCDYRISKGELPNGSFKFRPDSTIGGFSNVVITTISAATGGAVSESVESIRFNAPRYFTSQERAVTAEDYENLLRIQYPEINAVSVFGGEESDPPQFGKVFVSVDLVDIEGIPDNKKREYYNFLKPRSALSIDPIIIDPDYMYTKVDCYVRFNPNVTSLNESDIQTLVLNAIKNYNSNNLDDFKSTLRYSKLVQAIDQADSSILSNDTNVNIVRTVVPLIGTTQTYDIDFQQALEEDFADLGSSHDKNFISAIYSTEFYVNNALVQLEDDGLGAVRLVSQVDDSHTVIQEVGTVDYSTGKVQLKNLNIQNYIGNAIKIYARPREKDIFSKQKTLLSIRDEDVTITAVKQRA